MSPRGVGGGGSEDVLLALGSNLGDRLDHLRAGVRGLARFVRLTRLSPVVESPPQGVTDPDAQGEYLNAVVRGRTRLSPARLLEACLAVEEAEGRTRSRSGAPRTLDVDILFFGRRVVDRPGLRIPHPRWTERGFVLLPLGFVAPGWRDPESGRTVEEVLKESGGRLADVRVVHPPDALDTAAVAAGSRAGDGEDGAP